MRKATGIVRAIDPLGRVVTPMELRRTLSLNEGDGLEIFVDSEGDGLEIFVDSEGEIILRKYQRGCVLCGSRKKLHQTTDKLICKDCITTLSAATPC